MTTFDTPLSRRSRTSAGADADEFAWDPEQWQPTRDALTGLPSLEVLRDRLDHALVLAERSEAKPAVLFIDLDRFKGVNDQLGNDTGDRALIDVAHRIEHAVRRGDTVSRVHGDEFVVMCDALGDPSLAALVAARVMRAFEEPFDFDGEKIALSASIGIARGPAIDRTETPSADRVRVDASELLDQAERAMFRAKDGGRNCIHTHDAGANDDSRRRIDLERALRDALDNDDITVAYQPIFDTELGALVAFEALVRWHDPELGTIRPNEFIPAAEATGLITSLGERVLDVACRDAATWRDLAGYDVALHVNISARQLAASSFVNFLGRVLRHHHVEPSALILECAEALLLDHPERAASQLMSLREIGVRTAIDDVGVGYSSLASLRRFPLDVLKVHRQFVAGVTQSPSGRNALEEIVQGEEGLHHVVIAQGVEQPDELAALRDVGFRYAQGYLLGAPMPAPQARALAASSPLPAHVLEAGATLAASAQPHGSTRRRGLLRVVPPVQTASSTSTNGRGAASNDNAWTSASA